MSLIRIYAGGKMKASPLYPASQEYIKRLHLWRLECIEVRSFDDLRPSKQEYWTILDAKGENMDSQKFFDFLLSLFSLHHTPCFLIGPSMGLPESILNQAHKTLSFGRLTWPHLLVRLLLLEQIYRAQQRFLHHPYSFI